jgi:uncharacterized membrane protein YdbT with pleckstrin-like domain
MQKNNSAKINQNAYKQWRRQKEKEGFQTHFRLYLIIVPILATVNLLFVPQFLWFFFPMAGWGVGVIMHYLFGIRRLEENLSRETVWIDNMADDL